MNSEQNTENSEIIIIDIWVSRITWLLVLLLYSLKSIKYSENPHYAPSGFIHLLRFIDKRRAFNILQKM